MPASVIQSIRSDREQRSFEKKKATSTIPINLIHNTKDANPLKSPLPNPAEEHPKKNESEESVNKKNIDFDESDSALESEEKKQRIEADYKIGATYVPTVSNKPEAQPKTLKSVIPKDLPKNKRIHTADASNIVKKEVLVNDEVKEYKMKVRELSSKLEKVEKENEELEKKVNEYKSASVKSKMGDMTEFREIEMKLQAKQREDLMKLRAENTIEIERIQESNAKQIKALEEKRESILRLEQENWERDRNRMKELHKMSVDSLEKQHQYNITKAKRRIEDELPKSYLQHDTESSNLKRHVDFLMSTMKIKLNNEFNDKARDLEARQAIVEQTKRKHDLDIAEIEIDKQRLNIIEKNCKERKRHMNKELDEYNALCDTRRESLEEQYKETLRDINEKNKQVERERRQIESERIQLDKIKKKWEIECEEKKMEIKSEYKLMDNMQKDFNSEVDNYLQLAKNKAKELNAKRLELAKEQEKLLERQKEWDKDEAKLKHTNDELQLNADKYCYELRQFEAERAKLEDLALKIEEESKMIYKYKSSAEDIKEQLQEMRNDIDLKELMLRKESSAFGYKKNELDLKESALLSTQAQYFKEKKLGNTQIASNLIKVPRELAITTQSNEDKSPQLKSKRKKKKSAMDKFKADEFIKELERNNPSQPNYIDYIVSERAGLMKHKQGLEPKGSLKILEQYYRDKLS